MPISPIEVASTQEERDYRKLCDAIDKAILDRFQSGQALKFIIKEETSKALINRADHEYADRGWKVMYAEEIHEKCPCGIAYDAKYCQQHTIQPPNTKFFIFSEPVKKSLESMTAEQVLDKATRDLPQVHWNLSRSRLSPPQYEVIIDGTVAGNTEQQAILTAYIKVSGNTPMEAANLASQKFWALMMFVPDIKQP